MARCNMTGHNFIEREDGTGSVCELCDTYIQPDQPLTTDYAHGLAEGRAQGLEEAAAELDNNGYGIMPKVLRDRAEQIRAENGGRE